MLLTKGRLVLDYVLALAAITLILAITMLAHG